MTADNTQDRVPVRAWVLLAVTVLSEIIATVSLRFSEGFTVAWAAAVSIAGYLTAVIMLSRVIRYLPMSLTYVIWTGAGTAGVLGLSILLFGDRLTPAAWAGIVLVVVGVIMVNLPHRAPRRPRRELNGVELDQSAESVDTGTHGAREEHPQ